MAARCIRALPGGTGKDTGKRHPTLGRNVMVGCGAKVLGPVRVGDNCKIAANAVLLHSIDADSTAVGVPARVVRVSNVKLENERLDHVHIPDPIQQELNRAHRQIAALEQRLTVLEAELEKERENSRCFISFLIFAWRQLCFYSAYGFINPAEKQPITCPVTI